MSKKVFVFILCLLLATVAVFGAKIIKQVFAKGANAPEDAVWCYEKASMLYDVSDMMKYSSDYNISVLNDANPSNDSVEDYLKRLYEKTSSIYAFSKLTYSVTSKVYYERHEAEYGELLAKYLERSRNGDIEEFCKVTLKVFENGEQRFSYPAYAVKYSGRWFFFKPAV